MGEIKNTVILIPSAYRLPGVSPDPCTNWSETFVRYKYKETTQQEDQRQTTQQKDQKQSGHIDIK